MEALYQMSPQGNARWAGFPFLKTCSFWVQREADAQKGVNKTWTRLFGEKSISAIASTTAP